MPTRLTVTLRFPSPHMEFCILQARYSMQMGRRWRGENPSFPFTMLHGRERKEGLNVALPLIRHELCEFAIYALNSWAYFAGNDENSVRFFYHTQNKLAMSHTTEHHEQQPFDTSSSSTEYCTRKNPTKNQNFQHSHVRNLTFLFRVSGFQDCPANIFYISTTYL